MVWPKLYFYDTGLAAALLGIEISRQLELNPFRVALFENFGELCATEILQNGGSELMQSIKKALKKMKRRLMKRSVCIFPEGTSTNGRYLLPFKSNLFQASIDTNKSILPLCLRYKQKGIYSDKVAFVGDMSLVDSIMKIKNENDISVEVDVLQPIRPRGNRKELAVYIQEIIHKNLSQNLS